MKCRQLLAEERDTLREEWRRTRALRLDLKKKLLTEGLPIKDIRTDIRIKALRKQQHTLAKRIIHIEKKILKQK